MLSSKQAMIEINKILSEICTIPSLLSVTHMQTTIENCVRCIDLADEVIKKDPSSEMGMYYLALIETISKKLRHDCSMPFLADMILKRGILVGKTVKRMNT